MQKDKCVICHQETKYDKDVPVHMREHYVEGSGQLCSSCFSNLVIKKVCGCKC